VAFFIRENDLPRDIALDDFREEVFERIVSQQSVCRSQRTAEKG
jgi:hypothetical protein